MTIDAQAVDSRRSSEGALTPVRRLTSWYFLWDDRIMEIRLVVDASRIAGQLEAAVFTVLQWL